VAPVRLALFSTLLPNRAALSATTVPRRGNFHLGVGRKLVKFTTTSAIGIKLAHQQMDRAIVEEKQKMSPKLSCSFFQSFTP
jgi:hypothetical protein